MGSFNERLKTLIEKNWKVKKLIEEAGGYENCSSHVKSLIKKEMDKIA